MSAVLDVARQALSAGLCPVPPREDGSKAPEGFWKEFQTRRPTAAELEAWYGNGRAGVGLVCGAISGGLELLEWEGRAVEAGVFDAYIAAAEAAGIGGFLERIAAGYSERTPSGGIHLLYRCPEPRTAKLARQADQLVLIETKGEGGYVIVAPSNGMVHETGRPWVLVTGGLDSIVSISGEERDELHALARTFDETPQPIPETPRVQESHLSGDALRPGDAFNARATWPEVLEPSGWVLVFERGGVGYWRRPGKARGWSATTNRTGKDTLIVFSSSTDFEAWDGSPGRAPSYSKFAAYAALNHRGTGPAALEAAAKALHALGYGDAAERKRADSSDGSGKRRPDSLPATASDSDWPVLDPVAYHGLAGRIVRALEPHSEADPVGLLLVFLAFFGSAVGANPHALADGCVHALRLFVALVGDTARARKGTTGVRIRSVYEHADPTWTYDRIMSGFGSGEAIVDEVRDPKMGTNKDGEPVVVDQGVEDKRLLVLEGEFARILAVAAREGSTISAIIRDAWDLGRLAARARQQKSVATGAHVSFVVNITVEELRRRLSETEMANGLANRFLFACVKRSKLLPSGGQVDPEVLRRLGTEVRLALQAARKLTRVERSAPAEVRWAEMYAEMAKAPGGLLGAITARAEAQTLRLSVGYALLDGSATVEQVHLEAAYALWRYCEDSAAHIFGDALGDDVADRLLAAIRIAGDLGLDFTEQTAVFGRNVKAKRLATARAALEAHGLIRTESEETGGRPRMASYAITKKTKQTKEAPGDSEGEGGD